MVDVKRLTLAGLAEGATEELFAESLKQVLANMEDPNTDAKAKRRITLTFDFTADDDRRVGDIVIACTQKLAGIKGLKVPVYYGRHEGQPSIVEGPNQKDLFSPATPKPRIVESAGKV